MNQMTRNKVIIVLLFICFSSCGIKTRYLRVDSGKVPVKGYVFKNRIYFNDTIFKSINFTHLYKLKDSYYCDSNMNKIENKKNQYSNWILILQFYKNGNIRRFAEKFSSPDPEKEGNRGIVYTKNKQIYIDICEAISNNVMVINTYRINIKGDVLILKSENPGARYAPSCFVFEKSDKLPDDWNSYKADW
jgi:hypothetical protein